MLFRPLDVSQEINKVGTPCFFFLCFKILKNSRKKTSTIRLLFHFQMLAIFLTIIMNFPLRGGKDNHYLFLAKKIMTFFLNYYPCTFIDYPTSLITKTSPPLTKSSIPKIL